MITQNLNYGIENVKLGIILFLWNTLLHIFEASESKEMSLWGFDWASEVISDDGSWNKVALSIGFLGKWN